MKIETTDYEIRQFLKQNSSFPNWKNSRILLIFQIVKSW